MTAAAAPPPLAARADRALGAGLRAVPIACLAALLAILLANAGARALGVTGFAWFDEVVQGLFAWMVFVGSAALWRDNGHFRVAWLEEALPTGPSRALRALTAALSILFLAAMTFYGARLTLDARALTPILDLPTALFYLAIPVSGAVMLLHSAADLIRLLRPRKDPAP